MFLFTLSPFATNSDKYNICKSEEEGGLDELYHGWEWVYGQRLPAFITNKI